MTAISYWISFFRHATTALVAVVAVALVATACGDPQVPVALSSTTELVQATAVALPPTPTPLPLPTVEPTPESGLPVATPQAVEQPGLSNDTIRVAVIFDDETAGAADNLFRDAWLGAQAWQAAVNSTGGLGGRRLEVVPLDSRLFDHRSALEEVCSGNYFAIIGSHSLGDFEGAEVLGTDECLIADFAGEVYGSGRAASPVTFLSNPFLNDTRQSGPARYLFEKFPDASQNLGLFYYFALDLQNAAERQRDMLQAVGMNVVFDLAVDLAEDPAERIVPRWEELGAESLVWTADPGRLIEVLESLDEPPVFTLCEWGCYTQQFPLTGGAAVEGVYAWIPHSPFGSANARGDIVQYQLWLTSLFEDAGWSEIGFQTWLAGRLFEATFNSLILAEPEAPTRRQLIEVARRIEFYTANGVLSLTSPGSGEPTPCFVLMIVRNGRWEQEYPDPITGRDKDCTEENLYELVTTRSLGVPVTSASSSENPADGAPTPEPAPDLENPEDLEE